MSAYLTVAELGSTLKVSQDHIRNLVGRGVLPGLKGIGNIRFKEESLCKSLSIKGKFFPCEWYTANEIGKKFKVSGSTVLRWARQGKIRFYAFGKHTLRFRLTEIEAAIDKQKKQGRKV